MKLLSRCARTQGRRSRREGEKLKKPWRGPFAFILPRQGRFDFLFFGFRIFSRLHVSADSRIPICLSLQSLPFPHFPNIRFSSMLDLPMHLNLSALIQSPIQGRYVICSQNSPLVPNSTSPAICSGTSRLDLSRCSNHFIAVTPHVMIRTGLEYLMLWTC